MSEVCPHCGQRMLMRLGVALSPRQADIFDMIEAARPNEQILWVLFPNRDKRTALKTLRVHICQINDRLVETDFQIRSDRDGNYLIKRDFTMQVA